MFNRLVSAALVAAAAGVVPPTAVLALDPVPATVPTTAPAPGAAVLPRLALRPGQAVRYAIRVEQDTRLVAPGGRGEFALTSCATFDTLWTVRATGAGGDAEVEVAVERFAFTAESPMTGKVVAGTGQAPAGQPAAGIQDLLGSTQQGPIKVTLSPDGRVRAFRLPAPAARAFDGRASAELTGFFGDLFSTGGVERYLSSPAVPLPAGPVRRGGEWTAGAIAFGMESRDTYRAGAVPEPGRAGALLAVEITSRAAGDAGAEPPVLGTGTLSFDVARNRLVSVERHYDLPFVQPGSHSRTTVTARWVEEPAGKR